MQNNENFTQYLMMLLLHKTQCNNQKELAIILTTAEQLSLTASNLRASMIGFAHWACCGVLGDAVPDFNFALFSRAIRAEFMTATVARDTRLQGNTVNVHV